MVENLFKSFFFRIFAPKLKTGHWFARNVHNHIKKLQEMGILRRKGGDFGGSWEIIKDEK